MRDRRHRRQAWLIALALLLVTLAAYQPAWHGGPVWDDDFHLTRPELQSWDGLRRIWTEVGATLQYYPLLHTVFWLEHRLWGDTTLGYHLTTILLHVLGALLFGAVLRRLRIPGAALAAAVFALHPVQVESVAWMTELKNTLSGVFYFGAAWLYLRFHESRRAQWYASALGVFGLALLSKTVTGTLPGALLLVIWWRHGRLAWRRDIVPMLPWLVLGAGFGMITARWELVFNHCDGPAFQFTALQRVLIAGRAIWFHLRTLVWPTDLLFMYPRWQIDAGVWWQYLFPLGWLAVVLALWALRRRTRGALTALLFHAGTLLPTLGFFSLYTFRYSLVANHYQYLACAGIIALAAAGLAGWRERLETRGRRAVTVLVVLLLAGLATATRLESRQFADAGTLYRTLLERDPSCWFAHTNLGALALETSPETAIGHLQEAVRLKPDLAEAHGNLGHALRRSGRMEEAIREYREALRLSPALPGARAGLARALLDSGQAAEALAVFTAALRDRPDAPDLLRGAGDACRALGRPDEAIAHYEGALRIEPERPDVRVELASALQRVGRFDEAAAQYWRALPSMDDKAAVYNGLGTVADATGRPAEAEAHLERALRLNPDFTDAHFNLANLLLGQGRHAEAVDHYQQVLRRHAGDAEAHNNLGIALIGLGRRQEAAVHLREALRLRPGYHDASVNLARLMAAAGARR